MPNTLPATAPEELAILAIRSRQAWPVTGLPDGYVDVADAMHDSYPDLPWNAPGFQAALVFLLGDPESVKWATGVRQSGWPPGPSPTTRPCRTPWSAER